MMSKFNTHTLQAKCSRKTAFAVAAISAVTVLWTTACSQMADGDDPSGGLFPMTVGTTWVYEVETEMKDSEIDQKLTLSVDRKIDFDGKPTWVRRSADGAEYYTQRDASGIYRVASRTDVEEQAKLDAEPRYILKTPLAIGTTWTAMTVPYLLRRQNEFPRSLKHSHQAKMTYRIESLTESVEVPYGKYTGCALVKGEATIKIFTDPINGFTDVPLITQEWYCPKVGLVKFEREEEVPGQFMTGGKVTYLLTDMR